MIYNRSRLNSWNTLKFPYAPNIKTKGKIGCINLYTWEAQVWGFFWKFNIISIGYSVFRIFSCAVSCFLRRILRVIDSPSYSMDPHEKLNFYHKLSWKHIHKMPHPPVLFDIQYKTLFFPSLINKTEIRLSHSLQQILIILICYI